MPQVRPSTAVHHFAHAADLRPGWRALRASLVLVWWWTAAVSLWGFHGISVDLLSGLGQYPLWISHTLIAGGAAVDLAIGLWLGWRPSRAAYASAGLAMAAMTLLATVLQPALWLHPLGPLLKNLPLAAALYLLWLQAGGHHAPTTAVDADADVNAAAGPASAAAHTAATRRSA